MKITQVLTTQKIKKITHSFVTLAYYKWREFKAKFYLWEDPNNIKVLDPKTLYCGSLLPHQRSHKGHLKKKKKRKPQMYTKQYYSLEMSFSIIIIIIITLSLKLRLVGVDMERVKNEGEKIGIYNSSWASYTIHYPFSFLIFLIYYWAWFFFFH